ncbi:MAG: hypothetical protein ACK4YO_01200 [Candidatus Altarchaeaceae archaeon]
MEPKIEKMLSIITTNEVGVLEKVASVLGSANINIDAIVGEGLAETGLIRIITSDTEKAKVELEKNKFNVVESSVIVVEIPNKPGQLMEVARRLVQRKVNIEFIYQQNIEGGMSRILIKPDNFDRAMKALEK